MSSTHSGSHVAACLNVAQCSKAAAREALEWYPGPGEYCPECGEALTPSDALAAVPYSAVAEPQSSSNVADGAPQAPQAQAPQSSAIPERVHPLPPPPRKARKSFPLRWLWVVAATFIATAAIAYVERRAQATDRVASRDVIVCAIPSAQQVAADLVRSYIAKNSSSAQRLVLANGELCDVRFSGVAQSPGAVIARDGIVVVINPLNPVTRVSERQLRAIFSGTLRDWSQVGGPRGPIVPILPADSSDEGKVLAATLLFGIGVDRGVRRALNSAEITRAVAGANRASRGAIGLVAFSQAVPAKVIPLAYLPPPSVLSIATGHYPYTMTIAVDVTSARSDATAANFVDYARSPDGAATVAKDGLIAQGSM